MTVGTTESQTLTGALAHFLVNLSLDEVPEETCQSARVRLLDILGVALAARETRGARALERVVERRGGAGEATWIGGGERRPAASAALLNGFLAHALDFDDTHHESRIHPSCVVIPAALAAAEANGRNGAEFLAAAVAGFEVCVRVGLAAPGLFHERGWHATSVCGSVAAAGLAARLYGLDEARTVHALGVATSTASGLREAYLGEGTDTKAFHAGWAAQAGVTAAELAAEGFTGAASALEGRFGYYNAFVSPSPWDLSARLEGLGEEWHTPAVTYKLFPCGSLAHACIDAALHLYRHEGVRAEELEEVVCIVPGGMVSTICEPVSTKMNPRSGYEAKFSVQYAVAAALARGRVTEEEFSPEALEDPSVRRTLARVRYEVDPELPFPAKYPGGVRVTYPDGRSREVRRANSPGTPERPVEDAEIVEKFMANARGRLSDAVAREVVARVLSVEGEGDLSALMGLLHVPE